MGGAPPRVTGLDLASRDLTGGLWGWVGNLTELETLRLDGNRLTGTVPSKLGSLTKLTHVYLAGNELEGCVPPPLREAAHHDLAPLGLPDCAPPTLLATRVDVVHDEGVGGTYRWWLGTFSGVFDLPSGLDFRVHDIEPSGTDLDFVPCPPCFENVWLIAEFQLKVGLVTSDDPGGWTVWLLLDPSTGEVWERSHWEEEDPVSFAITEQIAASVWVNTALDSDGEWVWP